MPAAPRRQARKTPAPSVKLDEMNDWLGDTQSRRKWLRFVALHGLGEMLVRRVASPHAALAVLEAELGVTQAPRTFPSLAVDSRRVARWLRSELERARSRRKPHAGVVVLVGEVEHELYLALASAPRFDEENWPSTITMEGRAPVDALTTTPRVMARVPSARAREAEYIVPNACAGLVVREALRGVGRALLDGVAWAAVHYTDGDAIAVPLPITKTRRAGS